MGDDASKVLLSKEPSGCDPAFDHLGIARAGDFMGALMNAAFGALDHVRRDQASLQ